MVVIALSIMIFTTTASLLSGLYSSPGAFAANGGFAIASSTAPTILSSQVDVSMVGPLSALPQITGASPEVFAFSTYHGVSFVVRGVDLDMLNSTGPAFREFSLTGAASVEDHSSAIVGSNLKARLGIMLPYVLPLMGSYSDKIDVVKVVGSFRTGTSMDDELLVSLDVARFLSGMGPTKVSIIRVSTSDPAWLKGLLAPGGPRFTLFDLVSQKTRVSIGESVAVSVGVRNWGTRPGQTTVDFSTAGTSFATSTVSLNASQSDRVLANTTFQSLGTHSVNVSIGGDFPVTLTVNITVVKPYLNIAAPATTPLMQEFTVTVTDYLGNAAAYVPVSFGSQTNTTDSSGLAGLYADQPGSFSVVASLSGYQNGSATVTVIDPSAYPAAFLPSVASFTLSPDVIKETELATGVVAMENDGSVGGDFNATVYVDSAPSMVLNTTLQGLESKTVSFKLRNLAPGTHIVQVANFSRSIVVQSWIVDNPDLVQLVMRYSGTDSLFPAGSVPIYQAAKISEGNVAVALFAIGGISATLALLAITSVFSKEIREGRRRLGILKTIGAPRSAIRRMVFPQALENGLAGAAIGVASGVIIADALSRSNLLVLFGHGFRFSLDANLLLLILLGAVVISVASALVSVRQAVQETTIKSIRRLEEGQGEPLDVEELIADE
jgi:ABC-type antimicrobial peptide transport system permease subunit